LLFTNSRNAFPRSRVTEVVVLNIPTDPSSTHPHDRAGRPVGAYGNGYALGQAIVHGFGFLIVLQAISFIVSVIRHVIGRP
jgi:hypothetical protein